MIGTAFGRRSGFGTAENLRERTQELTKCYRQPDLAVGAGSRYLPGPCAGTREVGSQLYPGPSYPKYPPRGL